VSAARWLVVLVPGFLCLLSPSLNAMPSDRARSVSSEALGLYGPVWPLPTLMAQTDDFQSGSIVSVGGMVRAKLDPANAYDNIYGNHYSVSVTINASSTYGFATLIVAVESNDGSGWVERNTNSYVCSYLSGPPPYAQRTCSSSWTHEVLGITVAGLGLGDSVRLKAKSFTTSNGAGGSFAVRGGDGTGPNPETYNGVTYTTDINPATFSMSNDFASGNAIGAVGFSTGANLDPGDAIDNVYGIHYYVSVTINGNPTTYGTATLTLAFESNDGTGSGWIERATQAYNCGYPSGPPPYSTYTCTPWSNATTGITVAGLSLNDSVRIKAKTFTTSNGSGGSFVVRGGDGVGVNPETYNGVTYTTKVPRGVAVRPELPERQVFASTASSQRFFVKNRGVWDGTLSVDYSCSGLTNCSVTPTSFTSVPPGESRVVTLSFTAGTAGTTGSGMVKVFDTFDNNTLRDSATVAVTAIGAPAPVVSIADVNPGSAVERGACLTVAAGSAAAFECGDLRIIHPLPATRTLNKPRVPTLLYNSASADPYPIIAANVTLASGQPLPDSVEAVLTVGGVEKARVRWGGSDWTAGATRRIALGYAASTDTTKVYDYTLEVATIYLPSARNATIVPGKLIIVNRRGGGFGAGWWLAGLERLELLADGSKLWIGGDGSARLFTGAGTNVWVAARLERPDTLTWDGSTYFVRKLPGGLTVKFNSTGQHALTVNRLGHQTSFGYTNGRLSSITLPSQGGSQFYSFAYDGNGQLMSVTAPGGRAVTVWVSALRLDSIRDPDNAIVKFTYENPSSRRVATRVDRRGAVRSYSYDAAAKVWRAKVDLQPDSVRIGFRALDVIGLGTATPKTATDTANVYTSVFGARQFTTGPNFIAQEIKYWLDRQGAPRRLVNALGQETFVRREDGEWQSLATELQGPTGFLTRARYDRRGNFIANIAINPLGTGQDAVTRYHYNAMWDFVDSVVTPTGRSTTMAYDPANGNRVWQQVGADPARRVQFRYGNTLGLVSSIVLPGTPADSIQYSAMGNVSVARSPRGFDTRYTADGVGRDTMIEVRLDTLAAVYQTTITEFDAVDRDTLQKRIGPPLGATPAETVFVRKYYNVTGQVDSLFRWSRADVASIGTIKTRWTYDLAGRMLREIAPDAHQETWSYDPAGSVVADSTRRGHIITMTYDALNRLATRALPAVSYASRNSNISYPSQAPYPAYQIGADNQTFTYDPLGQLATADNADAKVKRTYYPGGLLETDSLRIQTVGRDDWTKHVYGVRHTYDLEGRQTSLVIPQQLGAAGLAASIGFAYDPQVGQLQSVTDLHGNSYTFTYNSRAQLDTLKYPAQYREFLRYDADGRLAADTIQNTGGTTFPRLLTNLVRATTYRYDAQDRLLRSGDPNGYQDTLSLSYSGLGHIASSKLTEHGEQLYGTTYIGVRFAAVETFTFDALGNRTYGETRDTTRTNGQVSSTSYSNHMSTYQAGTARLSLDAVVGGTTTYTYDAAGNTEFSSNPGSQFGSAQERATFFAADGMARAMDFRAVVNPTQVFTTAKYAFDEYRYDALGRRVWVWSKKDCTQEGNLAWWEAGECKTSLIRRTVWDGVQELAEIQMPGGTAANEVAVYENDVATVQLPNLQTQAGTVDRNQYFGRVLYTPGRGIDQPLAVTRINYEYQHDDYGSIITYKVLAPITTMPFWNRNGDAAVGVFTTGARRICNPPTTSPGDCVSVVWPYFWSAFDRNRSGVWDNWHGTVLESKRDKTNLSYNRNRYYDPQTGRFTQEDPIGLAGGLNLYGFANGDVVNYSDPFGLKTCAERVADLRTRVARIRQRTEEYLDAFQRGIADQDHLDQLEGERQGFNNDMDAYHRAGCKDDDDDYRNMQNEGSRLVKQPLPKPQMRYGPTNYPFSRSPIASDALPRRMTPQERTALAAGVAVAAVLAVMATYVGAAAAAF
jgi:RHS repeat-associated protein